jgi:hypothetical protein
MVPPHEVVVLHGKCPCNRERRRFVIAANGRTSFLDVELSASGQVEKRLVRLRF